MKKSAETRLLKRYEILGETSRREVEVVTSWLLSERARSVGAVARTGTSSVKLGSTRAAALSASRRSRVRSSLDESEAVRLTPIWLFRRFPPKNGSVRPFNWYDVEAVTSLVLASRT